MAMETELRLTRRLKAPVERVFQAWTDPQVMAKWFFVGEQWSVEATNNLAVGGEFRLRMRADSGEEFLCTGVYREVMPPTRLVFTWTSYAASDTVVTLELRDLGGGQTELSLFHEGLVNPDIARAHGDGWEGCLGNLERMLAA